MRSQIVITWRPARREKETIVSCSPDFQALPATVRAAAISDALGQLEKLYNQAIEDWKKRK